MRGFESVLWAKIRRSGIHTMQPTEEDVMIIKSSDTMGVRKTMRGAVRDKISDYADVIVLSHE